MRRVLTIVSVLVVAAALVITGAGPAGAAEPEYYLSLGDSLAQGVQPDANGVNRITNEGYADQLYGQLKASNPNLVLVKLGCPGETTSTFQYGGICPFPYPTTQIAAAVSFLQVHGAAVRYLTLNVGSNDVLPCLAGPGGIDPPCLKAALKTVATNLTRITTVLKGVAAPSTRIAGMTYYDPLLAAWPVSQALARASVVATHSLNFSETAVYQRTGFRVAHVGTAFSTYTFTVPPGGALPLNVSTVCTLTWACSRGNIHANRAGYARIAKTFLRTLLAPA